MLLALACVVLSSVVAVSDVLNPRAQDRWVSDHANVIPDDVEARIDAAARALHTARSVELAVVTVDDTRESPKAFTTALFAQWKLGNAQTNNGVLVVMVMSKRRLEIETGTGIEAALSATWLADMQGRAMVPKFKARDFGGGLLAGVEAISAHIMGASGEAAVIAPRGEYRSDGTTAAHEPAPAISAPRPEASRSLLPFALGGLGLAGGGAAALLYRRRRIRTCTACTPARRMLALDEVADDAHLTSGQKAEELFMSVNYEVLICPGCQASKILRHVKLLGGFSNCSKCNYRTLKPAGSTTIQTATYSSGGIVKVTSKCKHCDHEESHLKYTSPRSRPSSSYSSSSSSSSRSSYSSSSSSSRSSSSSSSSSRSSSFGGGSSSGGGAGSSW